MKILSWNVNGLRSIAKKNFWQKIRNFSPDIIALQEIKALPEQLPPEYSQPQDYQSFFNSALRKGYSGTALYIKEQPLAVFSDFQENRRDPEGRILQAKIPAGRDHPAFRLLNIYFPNGKSNEQRLSFKLDFYARTLKFLKELQAENEIILLTGDVNTAHQERDLSRPKENTKVSGFLPQERAWIDELLNIGFHDCFRIFNSDSGQYTWWSNRAWSRKRNVGWRIDYFFASENSLPYIKNCQHLSAIEGSDHCPLLLEFGF